MISSKRLKRLRFRELLVWLQTVFLWKESARLATQLSDLQSNWREDDEDVLELPSSMTKRGLYKRFLKERIGIIQVLEAKCRVVGVRMEDSDTEVPDLYPSWRSFNRHWVKHWSKLIIAKPREDVCDDCWRYANEF